MGAGASSGRVTVTTPVYEAYETIEGTEKYRHLVIVDDGSMDRDSNSNSNSQSGRSWTPSLDFSVSDSITVTDDSTSRGETDSLPDSSCSSRDQRRQRRVRFANVVTVSRGRNGSVETAELSTPDEERELTSWVNGTLEWVVLRVDVEYGQTRSIRYDPRTSTVSDIVESLKDKLKFSSDQFFALSLVRRSVDGDQPVIRVLRADDNVHQKVTIRLREDEDLRCCLRVVFVPGDLNRLLAQDPEAFNYLYTQCCNDVIEERFAGDLNCNEVLDLAALHVVQWAYDERTKRSRIIKNIERSWELVPFVPKSLLKTMTERQMRRRISHLVKVHLESYEKSFQVKREYLRRIEKLPSFARRQFQLENSDEKILVGPKNGIEKMKGSKHKVLHVTRVVSVEKCQLSNLLSGWPEAIFFPVVLLSKFTLLRSLTVDSRLQSMTPNRTNVTMEMAENQPDGKKTLLLEASLQTDDVDDFVVWVSGYFYLYTNRKLAIRVLDDFDDDGDFNGGGYIISGRRPTLNDRELYNGPQVTRSHLCQPVCGYRPELEDVVNQLETVLPPQNNDGSKLLQLNTTTEYADQSLCNSNELTQTSGKTDSWTVSMSQREQIVDPGFHGNIDNNNEIMYHRDDIGDDGGYRNGFGNYHNSSDVDVIFRRDVNDPGDLSWDGSPSDDDDDDSWNDDDVTLPEAANEGDTVSCHLRRFFDDGRSDSFRFPPPPPPVESSLASFLDNIPEPRLQDNNLQESMTSESTSWVLSAPVGFDEETFPDGNQYPDSSSSSSDFVLPMDIPSQVERCLNHPTVTPDLEFSFLQNATQRPSPPPQSPPLSLSFLPLVSSPSLSPLLLPLVPSPPLSPLFLPLIPSPETPTSSPPPSPPRSPSFLPLAPSPPLSPSFLPLVQSPPLSPSFLPLIPSPETPTSSPLPFSTHISISTPLPPQRRTPLPPFAPRTPSSPSLNSSLSSPSSPPLTIPFLPPPISTLPAPPSSPPVDLLPPPPDEFSTSSYKDWMFLDDTDELLNKLRIQYNDESSAENDEKLLLTDGKVFPGLDKL